LIPSTNTARRTCPYSSTPFIPRPLPILAEGHLLPDFYSGATGLPGRFSEGFSLRRFHATLGMTKRGLFTCHSERREESRLPPNLPSATYAKLPRSRELKEGSQFYRGVLRDRPPRSLIATASQHPARPAMNEPTPAT